MSSKKKNGVTDLKSDNEELNKVRRERFCNLAPKRIRKVIQAIELLKNCSKKVDYEFSELDVEKIDGILLSAVSDLKSSFLGQDEVDINFDSY